MKEIVVSKNEAGKRFDKLLNTVLKEAPTSFIYKMLRKKNIVLNDKKASGNEKLTEGDIIKIYLSDETFAKFSNETSLKDDFDAYKVDFEDLNIVYEDKNILIANKAAGRLSQKAEAGDVSINEQIIAYLIDKGEIKSESLKTFKPGICNRLDRNTSGMIIFGKTLPALQKCADLLKNHDLDKYYLCLAKGKIDKGMLIKGYLKKLEGNIVKISEDEKDGNYIETFYEPLDTNGKLSLLKVKLISGKTHQIRAHLASIGHPIMGDNKYCNKELNTEAANKYKLKYQLLHAYELHFPEIEGELSDLSDKRLVCDIPNQFKRILKEEKLCLPGNQGA